MKNWCICNNLGYVYIPGTDKNRNNLDCLWYAVLCPACKDAYPLTFDDLVDCVYEWKRENKIPKQIKVTSGYLNYLCSKANLAYSNTDGRLNSFYNIPLVIDETVDGIEIDI